MLNEEIPLLLLVLEQIEAYQIDSLLDLLDSAVHVALLRTGTRAEHVRDLVLRGVLEEIPNSGRSHRIQLLPLFVVILRLLIVLLSALLLELLLIQHPLILVLVDYFLDFVFF